MNFYPAIWLLAACIGAVVNASEILEVDLIFPRNETYAPTDKFPVVFAFQNAERAKYINPSIDYTILGLQGNHTFYAPTHELGGTNWTDDTFFAHEFFSFAKQEGTYQVTWTLNWDSCDEALFENPNRRSKIDYNSTQLETVFTIEKSAPKADLVAATANKTCPDKNGAILDVTDETFKVPSDLNWTGGKWTNDTCVVVKTSTSKPDPCRVHVDKAAASSMEASYTARVCSGISPPDDCPADKTGAAKKLAVAGVSFLLAAAGALGFFLV